MKTIEEITQDLIDNGKDPEDFDIIIEENRYSVIPKWYYETKQIAKKEDIPLGIQLSEREIQEIIQGRQISDLEIQLLELQLGGI